MGQIQRPHLRMFCTGEEIRNRQAISAFLRPFVSYSVAYSGATANSFGIVKLPDGLKTKCNQYFS
jgi:hypothetical protein